MGGCLVGSFMTDEARVFFVPSSSPLSYFLLIKVLTESVLIVNPLTG